VLCLFGVKIHCVYTSYSILIYSMYIHTYIQHVRYIQTQHMCVVSFWCPNTVYTHIIQNARIHTYGQDKCHICKQYICVVSFDDNAMQHRFVAVVPRSTLAKRRFFRRRLNSKGGGLGLVWREVAFFIIRFVTWWGLSSTWQVFFKCCPFKGLWLFFQGFMV